MLSTGVKALRADRVPSALTMGPSIIGMSPFQITREETVKFGTTEFQTLMSDKGVSFGFSSIFGANVPSVKKEAWKVLLEADGKKDVSLKQVQDGEVDINVDLADLNFQVVAIHKLMGYDDKVVHTMRSYTGYDALLKTRQAAAIAEGKENPPTYLSRDDLSTFEKQQIYQSETKEDAQPLYTLDIEFLGGEVDTPAPTAAKTAAKK